MKVTVDLRHVALCLVCVGFGFGLRAFAAGSAQVPQDSGYPVTPASAPGRYDFKCVFHEAAGISAFWANEDLEKADGWNPYLQKMASQGWDPAVFIAPMGQIITVCFRRPFVEKVAVPAYKPPPAGERCSAAQLAEMRKGGMSKSAIDAACNAP